MPTHSHKVEVTYTYGLLLACVRVWWNPSRKTPKLLGGAASNQAMHTRKKIADGGSVSLTTHGHRRDVTKMGLDGTVFFCMLCTRIYVHILVGYNDTNLFFYAPQDFTSTYVRCTVEYGKFATCSPS